MVGPAKAEEAAFLADCWRRMLDELHMAPGGFHPDWRDRLARFFAQGMSTGTQGWFVARDTGGSPVASGGVFIAETSLVMVERIATVGGIYVEPAYRRRGLARRLTEAAIAWAADHGCTLVRLSASQPAESLYRSMGFQPGRELVLRLG